MAEARSDTESKTLVGFAERVVADADILCEETASRLLHALSRVDRARFVDPSHQESAFDEEVVSIGGGRSLIRPSTFALMVSLIGLKRGMRILEVGAGSGYGSAVLSAAGAHVFAIESDGLLAQRARRTLDKLHFHGVIISRGEMKKGWLEHAPFDGIVFSTPVDSVDDDVLKQLKVPGGRLVAPIRGTGVCLWETTEKGVVSYPLDTGEKFDGP